MSNTILLIGHCNTFWESSDTSSFSVTLQTTPVISGSVSGQPSKMFHFLSPALQKKKNAPGELVKLFFALLKRSITFYFKFYLHINCSVNLNWNNTQLYSSAKPLHNVPSSVFLFANFYFLPCLCRTSIQVWKKNWFCYVHKWIAKKEMLAKTSKCLCWNLLIGAAAQTRAVCKDHEILITLKRCGKFLDLDLQRKISIVLWLFYLLKHFSFIWRHCK